jgi:hypothetical protein
MKNLQQSALGKIEEAKTELRLMRAKKTGKMGYTYFEKYSVVTDLVLEL